MQRAMIVTLIFFATGVVSQPVSHAQVKSEPAQSQPKIIVQTVPISPSQNQPPPLTPLKDAATLEQIQEYLRLSGDMESFRVRWTTALEGNRSKGAPYWPEAFWTRLRSEMQTTDLMPMFVAVYQHGISKNLMQEVIDTYHTLGADHFAGTPACFKLGEAELALVPDMDKLKFAKTLEVTNKVYAIYKPEIKAAREKYMAEHPDWVDQ